MTDDEAQAEFLNNPDAVAEQMRRESRAMWLIGAFVLGCLIGWLA